MVTVDLDQCSTRQSITRVSFSHQMIDRVTFLKQLPHINHLQCEASEKTKPSTRQEAEEAGEQRDRGKIQNAKLMQQVHLQQQEPARGRRRRPRWRRGRQQQASWLSCFGVISIKEWIEGQRRTGSARGERSKRQRQQGGRPPPRPHSSPRRLASRTLVVFVQIGTLAECLHTLIAYTSRGAMASMLSCSSPSSSRMRWCEQYEQNTGTTVHVRVLVASSS